MTCLQNFRASVKTAAKIDPAIERWFHGTSELERELSERVVYLCSYFDRIPEQAEGEYADILLETLRAEKCKASTLVSCRMAKSIRDFAAHLEHSGDPARVEKGKHLRELIRPDSGATSENS